MLAQCKWDRASPLAREWGLWAVRNLCEGCPAAQEAIQQLQLCTTVESEELRSMGMRLELDQASGKLRMTPTGEAAAAAVAAAERQGGGNESGPASAAQ